MLNKSSRARFSTWTPPTSAKPRPRRGEERALEGIERRAQLRAAAPVVAKSATAVAFAQQRALLRCVDVAQLEEIEMSYDTHERRVGRKRDF